VGARKRPARRPLVDISAELSAAVAPLRFAEPTAYVYNPLDYAWELHRQYLERFGDGPKEVVFLGMNPGPWGMAQTGVPFGEVNLVRDWMGLSGSVRHPEPEHPKRVIQGLECTRSEVSGARLWGWARERFGSADAFFDRFFVINYCPLVFMEESAKNRTPDKLPVHEREAITAPCDRAFRRTIELLAPRWVIGVGAFAEAQAQRALDGMELQIGRILHPSPASPVANRGWAPQAEAQLAALGIL
jgi:single-strand selective monofunctional uracil DNA glycosylase